MEPDNRSEASAAALRTMLREVSQIQACQYFGDDSIQLVSMPEDHRIGQVLKRYIAMVLLTSAELRVVFKVHFNPEQMRAYRQAQGKRASVDELDDKQLIDYVKELANQMGGRVCRVLDSHQIAMGMSVPLCTRGIYEIYADYTTKTGAIDKFGDLWQLEGPFQTLYCSCYIEMLSKHDFSGVKSGDEVSEEGELDFL